MIAALTLAHTGIIAYALHKEQQEETFKFIGGHWQSLAVKKNKKIKKDPSAASTIFNYTKFQKLEFETTAAAVE